MGTVIGVVGRNCAGKDTVASILAEQGYQHVSLSDILREEAKKAGLSTERSVITPFANELRAEHGPAIFAQKALEKIQESGGAWVVTSIRHPAEVDVLKNLETFTLWKVHAPITVRFDRARQRPRDQVLDLEEFKRLDALEDKREGNAVQRVGDCEDMAHHTIINDKEHEHLLEQVNNLLN